MNIPGSLNWCACEDGPEVDVICIERLIVLLDERDELLRTESNLHSVAGNMSHDPVRVVPIVP